MKLSKAFILKRCPKLKLISFKSKAQVNKLLLYDQNYKPEVEENCKAVAPIIAIIIN